jgi:hypothetical protein
VDTWAGPDERERPLDEEEDESFDVPVVPVVADGVGSATSDVVVLELVGLAAVAPVPS